MSARLPDRDGYLDRWAALHGGYDPRSSRFVGPWLGLTYALARPLARWRVAPDVVTGAGLITSAGATALAAAGGRWVLGGALVVGVSGLLDSLDGAVAVLQDRTSRWGYVLDSVVDRIADLSYVGALRVAGAPVVLCVPGGALMFLLEYARARAVGAGLTEIGVVTVWERGTRVVVTAVFLALGGVDVRRTSRWAALGAAAWVGLGLVGCAQLAALLRRRLR